MKENFRHDCMYGQTVMSNDIQITLYRYSKEAE